MSSRRKRAERALSGIMRLRPRLLRPMPRRRMSAFVNGMLLAAVVAVSAPSLAAPPEQRPYSCRLLDDEQRKCAFGSCDARTVDRLRKECLRDGGQP
jgi:hypothetical protein